jgi:glycosyltransferase involved in cell wall biosynthesis
MRVLFVSNYPHLPDIRGGLQTTTHDLCLALQTAGAEAAVLCGLDEHGRAAQGTGASRSDEDLGYLTIRSDATEQMLPVVAADWNATAVVVQSGTALLPTVLSSLRAGRPTAVYLHNVEIHQLQGTLVPDPSLLYLANSTFTAERWRALCGLQCAVIPPVVAPERYIAGTTGAKVLFVNPTPIKGVELMFALAALCPDIPFLVVESWNLEPVWQRLCRHRARALGNIEWMEPTDDMRPVYAQSRMLLMPSVWEESFGRTVVEAQLNGLPVLASTRGALPENVGDGGLTVSPHAPAAAWAEALRRLYHDGEAFSAAARRKALGHVAATPLIVADLLSLLAAHATR